MKSQSLSHLAVDNFREDSNCAQAVLLAFSGKFNLSQSTCLKMASGFGGGIAMSGATCGALTGGIMALGLAGTGEGESKTKTYNDAKKLIARFEKKFGSSSCKLLTESKSEFDTKSFCDKFVRETAIMVEDILDSKE